MATPKHNNKKKSKDLNIEEVGAAKAVANKLSLSDVCVIGKNEGQKKALEVIRSHEISIIHGSAGTGKTHLAVGVGLNALLQGKCNKLILTRPYVEAGEHLGFLPGSYNSKIAPFMYPIMEISSNYVGVKAINAFIENGNIQVLPLAFMRGITFQDSFVVADEMQNATKKQMELLLTRVGHKTTLVVTGDTQQSDLDQEGYRSVTNGLVDAINRLKDIEEIGMFELGEQYCVRSPLVSKISKKYKPTS